MFAAFVHPADAPGPTDWSVALRYGDPGAGGALSGHVVLEREATQDGSVFAAFEGSVGVRPPVGSLVPRMDPGTTQRPVAPDAPLTLYLEPALGRLRPPLARVGRAVAERFLAPDEVAAEPAAADGSILYLVYRDLDPAEARAALCPRLRRVGRAGPSQGCTNDGWRKFLSGDTKVTVGAGDRLGAAAADDGRRRFAFGVQTRFGLFDPGTFYAEAAADALPAETARVQALRTRLLPSRLPLISGPTAPDRVLPWVALVEHRRARSLTYAQWRALGDRQKALHRERLLRRVRPSPGDTGPRFEFDGEDAGNVFQLEAVAELYVNWLEPWEPTTNPAAPGDPGYRTVDLLAPFGTAAQVQGGDAQLDGDADLTRVTAGRDTLELLSDTARPHRQYRIVAVDAQARRVTLDAPPQVAGSSAWRILGNPTLVLIDAFGSRVRGTGAVRSALREVTLSNLDAGQIEGLKRINKGFDTVAFPAADAGERSTFRIAQVSLDESTGSARLTLDADPVLPAAGSTWAVPAGLGGTQGAVEWPAKAQNAGKDWWDHYDGMMFLVVNGEVAGTWPWSTYSSRKEAAQFQSSLDGNRAYRFVSHQSGKHNTTFKVMDEEGLRPGGAAVRSASGQQVILQVDIALAGATYSAGVGWWMHFLSPGVPRYTSVAVAPRDLDAGTVAVVKDHRARVPANPGPFWFEMHDAVRHAAFFFDSPVKPDVAPPGVVPGFNPDNSGKGGIRMHRGYINGTGSQGCLVSPYFWAMRSAMARAYRRANLSFLAEHPDADIVAQLDAKEDPPPALAAYMKDNKAIKAHQKELAQWPKQLGLLEKAAGAQGVEAAKLSELVKAVTALQRLVEATPDDGDELTGDALGVLSAQIGEMLLDGDVTGLDTLRDDMRALKVERVAFLKRRVKELETRMEAESLRIGWRHAVQGELLIVRPDERPMA